MCRFSLGVAALALAASGALAHNSGQPGAGRDAQPDTEQRGPPSQAERPGNNREQRAATPRARESRSPTIDLRPLDEAEPEARRVVNDILSAREQREQRERREARDPAEPVAPASVAPPPRGEPRGEPRTEPRSEAPSQSGLRDLFSRGGAERVLERMVAGPLDRRSRVLANCPRGLARTGGCEPPGQARSPAGPSPQIQSLLGGAFSPLLFGLTGFDAGSYLYRDGYLLQLAEGATNGQGIAGYIPLLGGALASGNIWPASYGSESVPAYLVDFYNLGQPGSYRYADNTLFRIDQRSSVIQSVAALLTDDEVEVGEPMPAGYDVYNVPYPYRDRYADSADAAYRYADGYVYRVDPETRLVAEAIDLLT